MVAAEDIAFEVEDQVGVYVEAGDPTLGTALKDTGGTHITAQHSAAGSDRA